MAGKRVSLADISMGSVIDTPATAVGPVPDLTVDRPDSSELGKPTSVELYDIAENPVNRREQFGDLDELAASMRAVGQVQACAAVTRDAFLRIYPEHKAAVTGVGYVLVAGARRRRAAELNRTALEIRVNDAWAETRGRFYAACIAENGPRLNFHPWEEAVAIRELVEELGTNKAAGERLGLSPQVISQRLAVFRLSEPMQALLRAGELPIEPARTIAANVPQDEQLRFWQEQRWREARKIPKPPSGPGADAPARRGRPIQAVRVQWPTEAGAEVIAGELRKVLDPAVLAAVAEQLQPPD